MAWTAGKSANSRPKQESIRPHGTTIMKLPLKLNKFNVLLSQDPTRYWKETAKICVGPTTRSPNSLKNYILSTNINTDMTNPRTLCSASLFGSSVTTHKSTAAASHTRTIFDNSKSVTLSKVLYTWKLGSNTHLNQIIKFKEFIDRIHLQVYDDTTHTIINALSDAPILLLATVSQLCSAYERSGWDDTVLLKKKS